jgi:hypothetical protein
MRSQAVSSEKLTPAAATKGDRKQPMTVRSADDARRKSTATDAQGATAVAAFMMTSSGPGRYALGAAERGGERHTGTNRFREIQNEKHAAALGILTAKSIILLTALPRGKHLVLLPALRAKKSI